MNQKDKNNKDPDTYVKFEEYRVPRPHHYSETPEIIQWVINHSRGLIKNEKQATYALLFFTIIAIVVSLFLLFSGESSSLKEIIPKEPYIDPPKRWII
mgnify:FL=1